VTEKAASFYGAVFLCLGGTCPENPQPLPLTTPQPARAMLNSLEIRNYRNLKHLTIEKLGRVNLLVGKNNTGKTSVLEAVALCQSKNSWETLIAILSDRGFALDLESVNVDEQALEIFSHLFNQKIYSFYDSDSGIFIGDTTSDWENSQSVYFRLVKAYDTFNNSNEKPETYFAKSEVEIRDKVSSDLILVQKPSDKADVHRLRFQKLSKYQLPSLLNDNFKFVGTSSHEKKAILWDKISFDFTKIVEVRKALQLLLKNQILEINFIESGSIRVPKIQLNNGQVELLSNMGDGINRILTIILAMVNCEKGYLLIDEFENGLHYSVQEKLWEIIFYLAERLDIQVFATTHSSDAIRSFATVLAQQANAPEAGKVIRLQNHDSTIVAVEYTPEELEAAVEFGVEVR